MNILHLFFSKTQGGMEQAFLDYNEALAKDHNVTAVVHRRSPYHKELQAMDIAVKSLFYLGRNDIIAKWRIFRLAEKCGADCIIAHGNRAITLSSFSRKAGIPVIAVNHTDDVYASVGNHYVINVNYALKDKCIELGQDPTLCEVVPNYLTELTGGNPLEEEHRDHSPLVIGTLGRITHSKGVDTLIEAFAVLKQQQIPFKAIIGGDGDAKQLIETLTQRHGLQEDVMFVGWIYDKPEFFEKVDVFCLPSRHETFGIVILEAFAYHVPVIASDADGPSSIIQDRKNGLMVPHENIDALASALKELIESFDLRRELSNQAFQDLHDHYTVDTIREKLEAILKLCVQPK